jgi:hypothetical protein
MIQLIDGSRYLFKKNYEELKKINKKTDFELEKEKIYKINKNFRLIGIGELPNIKENNLTWFTKEVSSLFHCHILKPLKFNEELELIQKMFPKFENHLLIKNILNFKNEYNRILLSNEPEEFDINLKNNFKLISTRDIIKIFKILNTFNNENLFNLIERIIMIQYLSINEKKGKKFF